MLSPLCQYSAPNGHHTPWHFAHLSSIILRGPGLSFVEATSITPEGRITPEDSGIWDDAHVDSEWGLKHIVEFAHSQGQKIGIQIGHAGRKASTVAPWLAAGAVATEDVNGWPNDVMAPSAIPYNVDHAMPKEMTLDDIAALKKAWVAAVRRALRAGFDVIEIHNAHGYLLPSSYPRYRTSALISTEGPSRTGSGSRWRSSISHARKSQPPCRCSCASAPPTGWT